MEILHCFLSHKAQTFLTACATVRNIWFIKLCVHFYPSLLPLHIHRDFKLSYSFYPKVTHNLVMAFLGPAGMIFFWVLQAEILSLQ